MLLTVSGCKCSSHARACISFLPPALSLPPPLAGEAIGPYLLRLPFRGRRISLPPPSAGEAVGPYLPLLAVLRQRLSLTLRRQGNWSLPPPLAVLRQRLSLTLRRRGNWFLPPLSTVPAAAGGGNPAFRPWQIVRVGISFFRGVASVTRTSPHRNNMPLLLAHLDDAIIDGIVKQVAWSSCRSSNLARLVSGCVAGVCRSS